MDRYARAIVAYHGCKPGPPADFAKRVLVGDVEVEDWQPSANEYDWLGHGIYFWEHSPERARRWAGPGGVVIGAIIQLGHCLDLTDVGITEKLARTYDDLLKYYGGKKRNLPKNKGRENKYRLLDCLVINQAAKTIEESGGPIIQTVRGAFEEGEPAFPGSMLKKETHIQVVVRDKGCILGVFRPNFMESIS